MLSRYRVRAREFAVAARVLTGLISRLDVAFPLQRLGSGRVAEATRAGSGLALVEGWRGTITHRVELNAQGLLSRVKIVDPSFLNWPSLPVALSETIVPDFPLANKSFNLSYAGNDL